MKTFTIVHILLFLIALLVYQCVQAQDYVINTRGDTLIGEVKPLAFGLDKKVQIISPDKRKLTLPILQVKEFHLKNETYHPVRGEKGYTFMKLLKPGYLSLYSFQLENQVTYDGLFLVKRDGASVEVPNLSFRKVLMKFLEDCEQVSKNINDGKYGKKDLNLIVDEYNQCVTDRTIDHTKIIVRKEEQQKKTSGWDKLEEKVKAAELTDKPDALEMIADIKGKITRNEKVPNFLIEGLRKSLAGSDELLADLDTALNELKAQ
jgi:hypothetical protein